MKKDKNRLFLLLLTSSFFTASFLLLGNNQLQAQSFTPNQTVIPMNEIDSESLILKAAPNEQFTISPALSIPAEDRGRVVNLFAMVLNDNWVILMTESGWKPYSGEITMFGQIKLEGDILKPFTLDGSRLISRAGGSIDIFYGYEIEETVFLGNAVHFQKSKENKPEQDIFSIAQPSNPLEDLTPEKLPLNLIADNCSIVSPSLEAADIDIGNKAQIFAAVLADNYIIVKTPSGWELYDGGELKPFKNIVLEKKIQEFDVPIPSDYYGEVFYYYAYLLNRKTMVGNGMRVNAAD